MTKRRGSLLALLVMLWGQSAFAQTDLMGVASAVAQPEWQRLDGRHRGRARQRRRAVARPELVA